MSQSSCSLPTAVPFAAGIWQKADDTYLQPNSPAIAVVREAPEMDNQLETAPPACSPPPYSSYNKEYFSADELHSNGEPLTLARFMFLYGFVFFPFWLVGIYILFTPLKPTSQWESGKTEEEKLYLIKVLRETELKWARRCLLAFFAFCVFVFLCVIVIRFAILRH